MPDQRALKGDWRAELVRDMGGKPFPIIERWRLFGRTARRLRTAGRVKDRSRRGCARRERRHRRGVHGPVTGVSVDTLAGPGHGGYRSGWLHRIAVFARGVERGGVIVELGAVTNGPLSFGLRERMLLLLGSLRRSAVAHDPQSPGGNGQHESGGHGGYVEQAQTCGGRSARVP